MSVKAHRQQRRVKNTDNKTFCIADLVYTVQTAVGTRELSSSRCLETLARQLWVLWKFKMGKAIEEDQIKTTTKG